MTATGGTPCRVCGLPLPERYAAMGVCIECVRKSKQGGRGIPYPRYGGHDG